MGFSRKVEEEKKADDRKIPLSQKINIRINHAIR